MGTIQHHLISLEDDGKIISEKHSLYRFYFPVGLFKENQRNILKIINQDTAREILLYIIEKKSPSQSDLAKNIGISPASINWHMARLVSLGIISESRDGKYKKYQFIGDPLYIVDLLRKYHPFIWNSWSDRIAEMFLSLSKGEKDNGIN